MKLKKEISLFFRRRRKVKQLEDKLKNIQPKQLVNIDRTSIVFNSSENPKVSIIIPFYNQEIYTWNCLQYLHKNLTDNYPFEIILIDDNSSEKYDFTNVSGINLIKNETNLGFLKNINKGIKVSKGEYVYLLNNDTEVYENFLDELFYVFENHKNVGAVGSMLLNPDQTLQEAGCVFMKDFTIHQIVRNRKPFYPEVNYIRKVDYCSGCSLLFKKHKDNGELNLFDEQFAPAYFEETDLCFDLKYNQNKNIYYTPFSKVLHYNGITYNDKSKQNQESNNRKEILFKTNQKKFYDKWNKQINSIEAECVEDRILEINNNKSIVFFHDSVPEFDKDSGSNRLKEIMKIFVEKGFHVSFISKEVFNENQYIAFYQKLGINVFYEFLPNKDFSYFIKKFCKNSNYVWFYGPDTFNRYHKKIKTLFSNAKYIYDMVDIHHLRYQRALEFDLNNKNLRREANKYKEIEIEASNTSDFIITISDAEKDYMKSFVSEDKMITISNIHYPKISKTKIPLFEDRKDLVFIGSTHHPNIDALNMLYNEIMPLVWRIMPDIKVNVIGNISSVIAIQDPKIVMHGYVADIEDLFLNSKLMVAPLLIGAGVKGKIGQAFEYYLPVVTTTIGAEGMFLKDNENVLIADSAKDFANSIIKLYTDESLWNKLSNNSEESLYPFSIEKVNNTIKHNLT
jgi:GT2 family glycosyltransferase